MAKVAWIVPVARVLNSEHGDVVLDTPLTQIALEAFPNNYSFSIAFGIIDLNPNIENTIKFKVGMEKDDFRQELLDANLTLENNFGDEVKELLSDHFVAYDSNVNLNNVRFAEPGRYYIELTIDGNVTKVNFNVISKGV